MWRNKNLFRGFLFLISFVSLISQAAQLQEIDSKEYRTKTFAQSSQKTFWLSTPHGDNVLVALNDSRDNTLKIAVDGSANFHYVGTYVHKNGTHSVLPAGLYFWENKSVINVRPGNPSFYISTPQGYQYQGASSKSVFDPYKSVAIWKNVKNLQSVKKYEKDPRNNPWHPFDRVYIKNTLLLTKKITPKPTQSVLVPAAGPLIISVASSNVLAERAYDRWFDKNSDKNQNKMPLVDRQKLFGDAFNDSQQLKGKDFILVQEHPNGYVTGGLQTPAGINYVSLRDELYNQNKINKGEYGWGSVDIYYNQNQFALEDATLDTQNGRFVVGLFKSKTHNSYVGVASVHVEFNTGKQLEESVAAMNVFEKKYYNKNVGWVIAGDFNMSYNHPQSLHTRDGLLYLKGEGFYDSRVGEIGCGNRFTAFTAQGVAGFDYIFYKGSLSLGVTSVYPAHQNQMQQLLTHGNQQKRDKGRKFFSDHAIISAQFTVASQSQSHSYSSSSSQSSRAAWWQSCPPGGPSVESKQ